MANELDVLVGVQVDPESLGKLNDQLQNLSLKDLAVDITVKNKSALEQLKQDVDYVIKAAKEKHSLNIDTKQATTALKQAGKQMQQDERYLEGLITLLSQMDKYAKGNKSLQSNTKLKSEFDSLYKSIEDCNLSLDIAGKKWQQFKNNADSAQKIEKGIENQNKQLERQKTLLSQMDKFSKGNKTLQTNPNLKNEYDALRQSIEKGNISLDKATQKWRQLENAIKGQSNLDKNIERQTKQLQQQTVELERRKTLLSQMDKYAKGSNALQTDTKLKSEYDALYKSIENGNTSLDIAGQKWQQFKNNIEGTQNADRYINRQNQQLRQQAVELERRNTLLSQMERYAKQNPLAMKDPQLKGEFDALYSSISKGNTTLDIARQKWQQYTNSVDAAGKTGKTFGGILQENISSFVRWQLAATAVMQPVYRLREAIQTITDLDTAMVELKKVTDETAASYEQTYRDANKAAIDLGVSTKDMINSTAEWARLGYDLDASEILAKNAAIFKNISEDMSIDEATEGMVSSIKAFDIAAEDSLDGIISKVNVLGNEFAVSNKDINDALMRSASAMAAANNSIDETMALITAGTEITQDAASMGTALKTVSMRVRGLDEDGEALGDTLENIHGALYDLTGVSIMQDPDTFKSTYQIFKEIADVWGTMTDASQAEVLELLAGKRQGNVVAAILSNFDQAEAALEASMNSAGGAMKEQENAMDSIQAKVNALRETFTGMWQNLIDAEALKFLADMGTTLASLLNIANGLPAKLIAIPTLITAFKGLKDALKMTNVGQAFSNTIAGYKNFFPQINALGNALSMETQDISALGLAMQGLNAKQMQLVISTQKLGVAEASLALRSAGVERQDRIRIMTNAGLLTSTNNQIAASNNLTLSVGNLTKGLWAQTKAALVSAITNPFVWVGGAIGLVTALTAAWDGYLQKQEEKARTEVSAAEEAISGIDEELKSAEELQDKLKAAAGDKQALAKIQAELNEKTNNSINLVDGEAESYQKASVALRNYIAEKKREKSEQTTNKTNSLWALYNSNSFEADYALDSSASRMREIRQDQDSLYSRIFQKTGGEDYEKYWIEQGDTALKAMQSVLSDFKGDSMFRGFLDDFVYQLGYWGYEQQDIIEQTKSLMEDSNLNALIENYWDSLSVDSEDSVFYLNAIRDKLDAIKQEAPKSAEAVDQFFTDLQGGREIAEEAANSIETLSQKYQNFMTAVENDAEPDSITATTRAIEVLTEGLESGETQTSLFNKALNLLFDGNRPDDLTGTLDVIRDLMGEGENGADDFNAALSRFFHDGYLDIKAMREELELSDAAFQAVKDEMRERGVLFASEYDINQIGDGLGLPDDGENSIIAFESEAIALANSLKDGSIDINAYAEGVQNLADKYGLSAEAAAVFKRNMSAVNEEYVTAQKNADGSYTGGNMTAWLGIGGDTANTIEAIIADAQETLKDNEFKPSMILDTDGMMNDIRAQLVQTGEYTEEEIESIIDRLEMRTHTFRLQTALDVELGKIESFDKVTQEQVREALLSGFNPITGEFDLGVIAANISGIDYVVNAGEGNQEEAQNTIMSALGFSQGTDGNWNFTGNAGVGVLINEVQTSADNLAGVAAKQEEIKNNNEAINNTTVTPKVDSSQLDYANGVAQSTLNRLTELEQRPDIEVKATLTWTESNKPSIIQDFDVPVTEGTKEGQINADGAVITSKTRDMVNDGDGTELIMRADGTYGYVENNGLPGLVHLNPGDVVFSAEQTRKIEQNRYVELGKRYASGSTSSWTPPTTTSSAQSSSKSTSTAKKAAETTQSISEATEAANELNEKLEEIDKKEHLEALKKSIEEVEQAIDNVNAKIETFQTLLDLSDEDDYASQLTAYSNMMNLATENAAALYDEFNRLRDIVPQNADEAQELSSRMDTLGQDIIENAKNIREYSAALDMVLVTATQNQTSVLEGQAEQAEKLLDRNIKSLTQHTLLGSSSVFSTAFLLPSMADSAVDKKRKENQEILELETWLQEEIYRVKKRYADMSYQETMNDLAKQRQEALESSNKTSSSSSSSSSSSASTSKATVENAKAQGAVSTTGNFVLVDKTNYDAFVAGVRTALSTRISQMVTQFTNEDWQRIINANPLSAFVLDESSWNDLGTQIDDLLQNVSTPETNAPGDLMKVGNVNVLQDALNTLVADTVNTDDSSWTNLSEQVQAYITQTYNLTQEDWEALCNSSPLIAASLKLTGDNSWAARNQQLNGSGGIVPSMMQTTQNIVRSTVLPSPSYDATSYSNLGHNMGNTIVSSLRAVLDNTTINATSVKVDTSQIRPAYGSEAAAVGGSSSIVSAAQAEMITNGGANPRKNKYNGYDDHPWCGDFVNWCAKSAGINAPSQTSVEMGVKGMRNFGLYHDVGDGYTPKPGDFVYFDWGNTPGRYNHVGILEYYDAQSDTYHTIEGNTSNNSVARRARKISDGIFGFGNTSGLPRYAAGTGGALGGNALVGEKGRELAIFPNGQSAILGKNGAEIVYIPPMTQILPNEDTEEVLKYTGNKVDGGKIQKYASGTINRDITQSTGTTAADIDKLIARYCGEDSVLKPGMGKFFIEAQEASGIDALTLFGIAAHESGFGTSQIAKDKSNLFGYGAVDSNPYGGAYDYSNLEAGIVDISSKIGRWYVQNRGQNTLYEMEHDPAGTGYRYASDAGWDDKIAAHIDNFAAYLGKDLNAVTTALTDNVSATEDNTSAVKEEKTVSERIAELTKTPTAYSQDFLDSYMDYVDTRGSILNLAAMANQHGEYDESQSIRDSLIMKDLEKSLEMQLDLYSESVAALQKQYTDLQSLYYEYVAKGADTETLSAIIDSMSEVSSKIDEYADKWIDAIDNLGDSFTAVVEKSTAQLTEALSRSERALSDLNHRMDMTSDYNERQRIYDSIGDEYANQLTSINTKMDYLHGLAMYQRGETETAPSVEDGISVQQYAADQGIKVREAFSEYLGSFGDYEKWFNRDGTINQEIFDSMTEGLDEAAHSAAQRFAEDLSQYKILYSNGTAETFRDLMSQLGLSATDIEWMFDGNGDITEQGYKYAEGLAGEDKNAFMRLLSYQSALKKSWYELNEQRQDIAQSQRENSISQAQEAVDAYNTLMEKVLDMIEQNYQEEQEIFENAHNARMEQISEEREAIEDSYNRQIELLQDLKSEEDYNKELDDLTHEAEVLQAQIAALSLQGDLASNTERLELEKQLREKQEEIAQKQRDHEYEQKVEALQDDLEKQQEYYDQLSDTEDDYYEWQQELLEQRYTQSERYALAEEALHSRTFKTIRANGEETYESIAAAGYGTVQTLTEAYTTFAIENGERFANLGLDFESMCDRMMASIQLVADAAEASNFLNILTGEFNNQTYGGSISSSPTGDEQLAQSYNLGNNGENSSKYTALAKEIFSAGGSRSARGDEFERIKTVLTNRANEGLEIDNQLEYLAELIQASTLYGVDGATVSQMQALYNQYRDYATELNSYSLTALSRSTSDAAKQTRYNELLRTMGVIDSRGANTDNMTYLRQLLTASKEYGVFGYQASDLKNIASQYGISSYHKGRNKEELAVVLDNETILTPMDVSQIKANFAGLSSLITSVSDLSGMLAAQLPKAVKPMQIDQSKVSSSNNNYTFNFRNVTRRDIPQIQEGVMDAMNEVQSNQRITH